MKTRYSGTPDTLLTLTEQPGGGGYNLTKDEYAFINLILKDHASNDLVASEEAADVNLLTTCQDMQLRNDFVDQARMLDVAMTLIDASVLSGQETLEQAALECLKLARTLVGQLLGQPASSEISSAG
jgi:hypothetical protein